MRNPEIPYLQAVRRYDKNAAKQIIADAEGDNDLAEEWARDLWLKWERDEQHEIEIYGAPYPFAQPS